MGNKKSMPNKSRREKKVLKERATLVRAAMEAGALTKTQIKDATGLELWKINNLFTDDRELYAEWVVRRRTIVDTAADNIHAIVNNPNHAQHFQASKYVLQEYKSDLDESLESKKEDEFAVGIGNGEGDPIIIKFSKGTKKETEEDGGE